MQPFFFVVCDPRSFLSHLPATWLSEKWLMQIVVRFSFGLHPISPLLWFPLPVPQQKGSPRRKHVCCNPFFFLLAGFLVDFPKILCGMVANFGVVKDTQWGAPRVIQWKNFITAPSSGLFPPRRCGTCRSHCHWLMGLSPPTLCVKGHLSSKTLGCLRRNVVTPSNTRTHTHTHSHTGRELELQSQWNWIAERDRLWFECVSCYHCAIFCLVVA